MNPEGASFATAITCIDGRIHQIVRDRVRERYDVDFVDVITLPGVDAALTTPGPAQDHVTRSLDVSVQAHGSTVVILTGHTECAGNPVPPVRHEADIVSGVDWLRHRFPTLEVGGCLVDVASGEARTVSLPRRGDGG